MSSIDIDLENPLTVRTADASDLTPAPAPMRMPAREMRTVGGLMISAMTGLAALVPASSLTPRAVVPAIENKSTPR